MSMSKTATILDALERLRDACHHNAKDKGFWDEGETTVTKDAGGIGPFATEQTTIKTKPWNFGEKIALLHSELSELFEAWRKRVGDSDKDICIIDPTCRTLADPIGTRRISAIEEEVADVFIRLLDLSGKLEIDVGRVVLAKMNYNRGREHMHGRKC